MTRRLGAVELIGAENYTTETVLQKYRGERPMLDGDCGDLDDDIPF